MQRWLLLPYGRPDCSDDLPGRILLPDRWHVCRDNVHRGLILSHRGHDDDEYLSCRKLLP